MNSSTETTNIIKAMIEAAPDISSITKSKQAYGYKYATLDSLIDMLRSVLPKHGLWFMQMPTRRDDRSALTTRVFHSSGEWFEDSIEMTDTELQGKANDTQKVGASITYYRRYALSSIFGVAADEDVDGNINSCRPVDTHQAPKRASQQHAKEKMDPTEYLQTNLSKRNSAGESVESILKDYAEIIGSEQVSAIEQMSEDDKRKVAIAIFTREQQKR